MSRLNQKYRRRLKQVLNHGHEVRHKGKSGRTGKMHSVKMRSPKKEAPDGVVHVLVPGYKPERPEIIEQVVDVRVEPVRAWRKRNRPVPAMLPVPVEPEVPQPETSVEMVTCLYGMCLKIVQSLVDIDPPAKSKGGMMLAGMLKVVGEYEKK